MINCSCRSFSRVDRIWKAANTYVLFRPLESFQRCNAFSGLTYYVTKMSGPNDGRNVMGPHKKQKGVTAVWRPVSTQSIAFEGCSAKDGETGTGTHYVEVHSDKKSEVQVQEKLDCCTSATVQNVKVLKTEGETKSELGGSSIARVYYDQNVALEEDRATPSTAVKVEHVALEEGSTTPSATVRVQSLSLSQCNLCDTEHGETANKEQVKEDNALKSDLEEGVHLVESEKHSVTVEVASSLIRFIKGKGGATQKQFEEEMGVKIILPSFKEDSIVIEGVSLASVTKASEKIQDIIEQAVKSPSIDYSHFVSLPLAIHPALVDKLINFQNSVLGNCSMKQDENLKRDSNGDTSEDGDDKDDRLDAGCDVAVNLKVQDVSEHVKVEINKIPLVSYPPKASKSSTLTDSGIDKSIFIKPKTFHLTVLMLKLWNKDRVAAATEVLQRVSPKVLDALDGRPVSVRLKGLECMRGSQAKARVLYVPVEEIGGEDRLLHACQIIIDAYVEAGLVLEKDAQHKLKLHATVMNARHRKRKTRTKKYDSFDARGIFKQYEFEEWGEYPIHEAHLSQRFVFDDNGYYHCCASIPFPDNMQIE
ncbi:hypothetical protein NE237_026713 [Protea cynaroides]|uniref:K Homology domain-containing protein n=1 Tax=Protea cynaroides TaxID=273540 RepID=A0A9Q0H498_9MAGN|nr:hypothetical protein NE237_026713 [Protea cynaroides]